MKLAAADLVSGYATSIRTSTDGKHLILSQPNSLEEHDCQIWLTKPQILELFDYLAPFVADARGVSFPAPVGPGPQAGE